MSASTTDQPRPSPSQRQLPTIRLSAASPAMDSRTVSAFGRRSMRAEGTRGHSCSRYRRLAGDASRCSHADLVVAAHLAVHRLPLASPENAGGGAAATASSTARIVPRTFAVPRHCRSLRTRAAVIEARQARTAARLPFGLRGRRLISILASRALAIEMMRGSLTAEVDPQATNAGSTPVGASTTMGRTPTNSQKVGCPQMGVAGAGWHRWRRVGPLRLRSCGQRRPGRRSCGDRSASRQALGTVRPR